MALIILLIFLQAIGTADELTGQAVHAFVTLKPYVSFTIVSLVNLRVPPASEFQYDTANPQVLEKELVLQVRQVIGPFAAPKKIYLVGDLPKTRSGKIMRRILRKLVAGEQDQLGDLSTLADPSVVDHLISKVTSSK